MVDGDAVVTRARVDREPLADDQHLIETAVLAAAENVREHIERFALARPRARARGNEIIAAETRLGDARIGERDGAGRLLHRLLRANPRLNLGNAGHLAEGLLRKRAGLLGRHVAGDDEDCVVGRVETPVEL